MLSISTKQPKRRSRYFRQPQNLSHTLTKRDAKILQAVDRFDILTSQQIAKFFAVSRTGINKRLKLLFHHHYLGKLPAQLSPKMFNSPDIYHLDLSCKAGAALERKGIALPYHKGYNRKQPKRDHVQHSLLANDIEIAFEVAVRDNLDSEFLSSLQLLQGSKRAKFSHPWKVPAFLPEHGITRTVFPDAAFALLQNRTGRKQLFLVEADCMSEPLRRRNGKLFKVSNIKAKLLIYFTAWKQGLFREKFGIAATRILFVTLSSQRAKNMKELANDLFDGTVPGLFVFTDKDSLNPNTSFWSEQINL